MIDLHDSRFIDKLATNLFRWLIYATIKRNLMKNIFSTVLAVVLFTNSSQAAGGFICEIETSSISAFQSGTWSLLSLGALELNARYMVELADLTVTQFDVNWNMGSSNCQILTLQESGEPNQLRCVGNHGAQIFSVDLVLQRFILVTLVDGFDLNGNTYGFLGTVVSSGGCTEMTE